MLIQYGYELTVNCVQATPLLCLLDERPECVPALRYDTGLITTPNIPTRCYVDAYGNRVRRLVAPIGDFTLTRTAIIEVPDAPDPVVMNAGEVPVENSSRRLSRLPAGEPLLRDGQARQSAWSLFGTTQPGWPRVQAICDFVNTHLTFGYQYARPSRTALEAYEERVGVCRDFTHLAVAFCRCMNIPARYANGFLGDIGVPPDPSPMDYNAWFEVYLGGRWYVFDARHNMPRIGRIGVSHGRDAMDVPLVTSFGRHELKTFKVWTDEVDARVLERTRLSA